MAKISIIIPVYNAENVLKKCLDSVCEQTLKDIEVICINDCSTDNSLEILNEYAKKDKRITIISFERNQGVSVARNTGINATSGEYIGFVDSDDWVDTDFFEKLYSEANYNNANFVVGNIRYFYPNTKKMIYSSFMDKVKDNYLNFNVNFYVAIYKRDFVIKNDLGFTLDSSLGEDRELPIKSAIINDMMSNKLYYVEDVYYTYVQNENSLYNSATNKTKISGLLKAWINIANFVNSLDNFSEYDYKYLAQILCNEYCQYFLSVKEEYLQELANGFILVFDLFSLNKLDDLYFNKIYEFINNGKPIEVKKFIIFQRYKNAANLIREKGKTND